MKANFAVLDESSLDSKYVYFLKTAQKAGRKIPEEAFNAVVTKVGAHVRDQRSVKGYKVGLHFALVPRFRLVSHLPLIQKPVSYNKDLPTFLFDGKQMFAGESQAEVEARKQVGKIRHPSKNNKQATTFIEIDNTDPHTSTAPLPTLERYGGLFFASGTTNDTWPSLQHDSSSGAGQRLPHQRRMCPPFHSERYCSFLLFHVEVD